jgi:hypothetical protein
MEQEQHTTKIVARGHSYQVECSCGWKSDAPIWYRWKAEDAATDHVVAVTPTK